MFITFAAPSSNSPVSTSSPPEKSTNRSQSSLSEDGETGSTKSSPRSQLVKFGDSPSACNVPWATDEPVPTFNSAHGLYSMSMRQGFIGSYYSAYNQEIIGGRRNWMSEVPGFSGGTKVVESASMAFCLSGIGQRIGSEALQRESLAYYTKALRQLQQALWDPKHMYSDETLASCMLLTMYEVTECPDKGRGAFISHYNGLSRLIELRGPNAHITGLGHDVFVHFRSFAVRHSLRSTCWLMTLGCQISRIKVHLPERREMEIRTISERDQNTL
jgi:Fungal specific transcription factor domain